MGAAESAFSSIGAREEKSAEYFGEKGCCTGEVRGRSVSAMQPPTSAHTRTAFFVALVLFIVPLALFGSAAGIAIVEEASGAPEGATLEDALFAVARAQPVSLEAGARSGSVGERFAQSCGRIVARGALHFWPSEKGEFARPTVLTHSAQTQEITPSSAPLAPPQTMGAFVAPRPQGAPPTEIVSTWNAGDGDWSVAANWENDPAGGSYPNNGNGGVTTYDAIINNNSTVGLTEGITVRNFTLSMSNLAGGAFSLTIEGLFTWSGGTMSGSGTTNANGGISFADTQVVLDGRTLNNTATMTLSNFVQLNLQNGAVLNNSGAINVQTTSGSSISNAGGGGTFNNSGTLTIQTGDEFKIDGVVFKNSGTVNVQSGRLFLNASDDGNTTGDFSISSGANLIFGGNYNLSTSVAVSGAGEVEFQTGTINIDGSYGVTGTTVFSGATVNFNNPITSTGAVTISDGTANFGSQSFTMNSLTHSAGTLSGTGTIASTGQVNWTGSNGSTATVNGTGTLTGNGGMVLDAIVLSLDQHTVTNASGQTATLQNSARIDFTNGATFNNNGTMQVDADNVSGFINSFGTSGTFNNAGTFKVASSGGTFTAALGVAFKNSGTVNVQTGTLSLQGSDGGSTTGDFTVSSGATLEFASDVTLASGADISGAGAVVFSANQFNSSGAYNISGSSSFTGATATFNAAVTNAGAVTVNGSSASFNAAASVASLTLLDGNLGGSGIVTSSGPVSWEGGIMSGSGTTQANGGLSMSDNDKSLQGRTLRNAGTGTWTGGAIQFFDGGKFANQSGATFTTNFDGTMSYAGGAASSFTNAGTFTKSGGGGTTTLEIPLFNTGTVNVNSGTLAAPEITVTGAGSLLAGSGKVQAPITIENGAKIQGGNGTTGTTLTVEGALTLQPGSIIQLALGPSGAHSTLARNSSDLWSFDANQLFTFLNAQAGTYQNIITGLSDIMPDPNNWTATNSGFMAAFAFDGNNIDVTLTVVPVPEPATWLSALLVTAFVARIHCVRRRAAKQRAHD